MADVYTRGLSVKLTDPSVCIKDKLKLGRFAWKSPIVSMPNKQQTLVNTISGYLVFKTKYKVSDTEELAVWTCLEDMLKTKTAQYSNSKGQTLVLKRSFCELVLTTLAKYKDQPCHNDAKLQAVIGCCLATMQSASLSQVFTAKFESMIELLTSLCRTLINMVSQPGDLQMTLINLLHVTADRFNKTQKLTTSHLKVLLEKLVTPILTLREKVRLSTETTSNTLTETQTTSNTLTETQTNNLREITDKLTVLMEKCFFHKDHLNSYATYLSALYGEGENKPQPPKMVENLFQVLSTTSDIALYAPVFYSRYCTAIGPNPNQVSSQRMFVHCCRLIGVLIDGSAPGVRIKNQLQIKGVNLLLQVVQRQELYRVLQDKDDKFLKLLKHLSTLLLDAESLTSDWYSSFTVLLELNQHIVESSLVRLLSRGWLQLSDQDYGRLEADLEMFLGRLFSLYQKLSQLEKLTRRLLEAIHTNPPNSVLKIPRGFLTRFGEMTQALPQGKTVDILGIYVNDLKTYVDATEQQEEMNIKIGDGYSAVCLMLHQFLYHIKVADYQATVITTKNVLKLMETMATDIFSPLLKQCLAENKEISHFTSTLLLCQVWGEVRQMLALYDISKASRLDTDTGSHPHDLRPVHEYLSSEEWKKVYKIVQQTKDSRLLYVWTQLMIQKLRFLLLSKPSSDECVRVAMTTLLDLPTEVTREAASCTWNGMYHTITATNLTVVKWSVYVSSIDILLTVADNQQMTILANFVVDVLRNTHCVCGSGTLLGYTELLLGQPIIKEVPSLHTSLMTSMWLQILACFPETKKAKSQKKMKSDTKALTDLLRDLSDVVTSSGNTSDSTVHQNLAKWLGEDGNISMVIPWQQIYKLLEVFSYLPLNDLQLADRGRCLAGLVGLLWTLMRSGLKKVGQDYQEKVVSRCVDVMLSLETIDLVPALKQEEIYLCWMEKFHTWGCTTLKNDLGQGKITLLLEDWCHKLAQNLESLQAIQSFIKQIESKIKKYSPARKSACDSYETAFVICRSIFKELDTVMKQSSTKAELRELVTQNYVSVSMVIAEKISILEERPGDLVICSNLIGCLATGLTLKTIGKETGVLKQMIHKMLPDIVEWCLHTLQTNAESAHKMAALNFLYASRTRQADTGDHFTTEMKAKVVSVVTSCLKSLLVSQSKHSNLESVLSDTACHFSTKKRKFDENLDPHHSTSQLMEVDSDIDSVCSVSVQSVESILTMTKPLDYQTRVVGEQGGQREVTLRNKGQITLHQPQHVHVDMYSRQLMYEGQWKDQSSEVILIQVKRVLSMMVLKNKLEDFSTALSDLLQNVTVDKMYQDTPSVLSSLYVWHQLLQDMSRMSDDQWTQFCSTAEKMMMLFQSIFQQMSLRQYNPVVMETLVFILHTEKLMLDHGSKLISPETARLALYSCQYVPLEGAVEAYIPAFQAVYSVLNSLLLFHTDTMLTVIPALLHCAKRLLLSLMRQSNQEKISGRKDVTEDLIGCAQDVEKLFNLITSHKTDFEKVAAYVVSDYVTQIQTITLLPAVKKALLPAIYALLDICKTYEIAMLKVSLSHGVLEVFKLLYNDYNKYHKYTGKV